MAKELEVCKKEFNQASFAKQQADIRRNELQNRVMEESQLINTLKEIVKKLNKEITSCQIEKVKLKIECVKSDKLKQQVLDRLQSNVSES